MQLFFDIDGVLLNFERSFVAWLNREHGLDLPEDYQALSWDFTEVMNKRAMDESWLRFVESPAAGEMAPLIDPALYNALGNGHGVHLVTNFPQPHMEKRLENLAALGFRYDSVHYCGIHPFRDSRRPAGGGAHGGLNLARPRGIVGPVKHRSGAMSQ